MPGSPATPDITVVIATRNRWTSLDASLRALVQLPECPHLIVVDNASDDGTAPRLRHTYPGVTVVALPRNAGAAARTAGARLAATRWVAFCDDDSWWEPGSLASAVEVMRRDPAVALVAGRVLVGATGDLDPTSAQMAAGRYDRTGSPVPAGHRGVTGFLACAVVVDRARFLATGGFDVHLGIGGEEELVAIDLAAAGWRLVYEPEAVARHHPSSSRDPRSRRGLLGRNGVLVACQRLPAPAVARRVGGLLAGVLAGRMAASVLPDTASLTRWALAQRHVPGPDVVTRFAG